MGVLVIVAYRPKPGKEARLLELTKEHWPILRGLGLATDRPAYAMRPLTARSSRCSNGSPKQQSSRRIHIPRS